MPHNLDSDSLLRLSLITGFERRAVIRAITGKATRTSTRRAVLSAAEVLGIDLPPAEAAPPEGTTTTAAEGTEGQP